MTSDEIKSNLAFIGEYCDYDFDDISFDGVISETLNYINKLESEVESITEKFNCQQKVYSDLHYIIQSHAEEIKIVKSEAIKEFARKLKCGVPQETGVIRCKDVDDLVNRLVGENNGFRKN